MSARPTLTLLALALGLWAFNQSVDVVRAGDDADDEPARELKLLPTAKKGQQEAVEIEATLEHAQPGGGVKGEVLSTGYKRKIRQLDDDGLSAKEVITVEKADLSEYEASPNGSSTRSSTGTGANGTVLTIERHGRARRASGANGDKLPALPGVSAELMEVLRRDPDGLAALVQPDETMSPGDEWNVNRADLLALFGPGRVQLVKKGSRAVATFTSLEKHGSQLEAQIDVVATLYYRAKDAADDATPEKLKLHATLTGAIDGSAPPRIEETTITTRDEKDAKVSTRIRVVRTPTDPEPRDSADKDEKADKKAKGDKKAKDDDEAAPKKKPAADNSDDDDDDK